MGTTDVACFGELLWDFFEADVKAEKEGIARQFRREIGGATANVATVLARLGVEVSAIGGVGDDKLGDALRAALEADGVDISHVARMKGIRTGITFVTRDASGEPSFTPYRNGTADGAFGEAQVAASAAKVKWAVVSSSSFLPASRAATTKFLGALEKAKGLLVVDLNARGHLWADADAMKAACAELAGKACVVKGSEKDLAVLDRAIADDRAKGLRPFCVVGTAGTVNTGASDDLVALARIARREDLWLHVDGAFGAFAHVSEKLRPRVAGLGEADSISVDLHKWMYLPFDAACVLVKDRALHEATFASTAPYIAATTRGTIAGGLPFADRGLDLTRNFKALKVWMTLRAYGTDKLARMIEQNVAQADHLASLVRNDEELELLAEPQLNVVCFRYRAGDDVNEEIVLRLQERGIAVPSGTRLGGRFAIRVANVNHRSRREDFELLVRAVKELGREILGER